MLDRRGKSRRRPARFANRVRNYSPGLFEEAITVTGTSR